MSTRSTPGSGTVIWQADGTRSNGDPVVIQPSISNTYKWTDSVTYGENIPGWRQNLRDGLPATTTLVGSAVKYQVKNGTMVFLRPKAGTTSIYRVEVKGSNAVVATVPSGDPSTMDDAEANNLALGKFTKRIFDAKHAFQGGVVLGELGQTLRMIRNPAQGLRRLVDDWGLKARKIRGSRVYPISERKRRVLENLGDAWLEVQFGWRPLLNDVADGSEALRQYHAGQGLVSKRISAKGEIYSDPTITRAVQGASFALWTTEDRLVQHTIVVYRGAIRLEARDPRVMAPELIGFDLSSWLPTLWELMPYSFLIDYFSNVGDVIMGWSNLGTRLTWSVKTRIRAWERTSCTTIHPSWLNLSSVSHMPARVVVSKRSVSRAPYNGTTVPDVAFEIPDIGSLKWLNIAALIATRRNDRQWSYD